MVGMKKKQSSQESTPNIPQVNPSGKFFICEYCCEAFPEIGQLKNHECGEDIPQVNHSFICEYCGEAFPEIGSFRNHNCCDNILMSKCDFTSNKVPEIVRHVRGAHRTYFQ